jgi:hypothetical protein
MSDYDFHPIVYDYDDFVPEELEDMRASLKLVGLLRPIVIWKDQIVDGRHRETLCRQERVNRTYKDITPRCQTEEAMRDYVRALNQHRRSRTTPLTNEEKRTKAVAAVKADHLRSDEAIHQELGNVSRPTIHRVRKELEDKGVVPRTTPAERKSRTGKVGEGARKTTTKSVKSKQEVKATKVDPPPAPSMPVDDPALEERVDCVVVHMAIDELLDAINEVTPERVAAGAMADEIDKMVDEIGTVHAWLGRFADLLIDKSQEATAKADDTTTNGRHRSADLPREKAKAALRQDPTLTKRKVMELAGCGSKAAVAARRELEEAGEIAKKAKAVA